MSRDRDERATLRTPKAMRTPGAHTRAVFVRLRIRTLLTIGSLAAVTILAGRAFGLRSPLFMGADIAVLVGVLLICRWVIPLLDRHDRGATGEEQVGGLLEHLPAGWIVLHDVSLGRGNVDHIAIGPPGIFSVETKSHPGPIRVDRVHGAVLRQSRSEQRQLERLLRRPVEPLIVYSRAWVDRPLARRKGVRVLPARMLLSYLVDREARIDPRNEARIEPEHVRRLHQTVVEAVIGRRSAKRQECAKGSHRLLGGGLALNARAPRAPRRIQRR